MKIVKLLSISVGLVQLLAACQPAAEGPDLQIQSPWVRAVTVGEIEQGMAGLQHSSSDMGGKTTANNPGQTSAAYMTIRNSGSEADQLLKVESDIADSVEIHISEMRGDVMTMRPVEKVEIPSKRVVELMPGGLHVMFVGIHRDLIPGDKVNLVLWFEKSGSIPVEAEVRKQ